jgi:predicted DNA-binding transcriptional regulator YafY
MVAQVARREGFQELDRKFRFLQRGGEMALPTRANVLEDLVAALMEQVVVVLDYRKFKGDRTTPTVEPLSLLVHDHQLYLLGRLKDDGSLRPYRFSRIYGVTMKEQNFDYPSEAEFDPRQVFATSFGVFLQEEKPVEKVVILLDLEWKNYVQSHRWHASQRVTKDPRGLRVTLEVKLCPELRQWILGFGKSAEVLAPTKLREEIAAEFEGGAIRYRTRTDRP